MAEVGIRKEDDLYPVRSCHRCYMAVVSSCREVLG